MIPPRPTRAQLLAAIARVERVLRAAAADTRLPGAVRFVLRREADRLARLINPPPRR